MRLSESVVNEIGRVLNGSGNSQQAAIGHLATAAARAAESLVYLAEIDDQRFGGVWPDDGYPNAAVDDGHVRWASAGALSSLDLCVASAARLGNFALRPPRGEDSIRDYYRTTQAGAVQDYRYLVPAPWRAWIDSVVTDPRYDKLLRVRNALVHADALRIGHGTAGAINGHAMRYAYNVGPLFPPVQSSSHLTIVAREVVELSRDVALGHVGAFVDVLRSIS